MLGIWLQAIGFQLVWFAWALGVPDDLLWPGAVVSVVFLLAHRSEEHTSELQSH